MVYYNDGNIEWNAEPGDDPNGVLTVSKLGLDCPELVIIRRIWYYLVSHNETLSTVDRDDMIYELIDMSSNEKEDEMIMQFKNPEYWKLILQYDYFNDLQIFTVR